MPAQALCSTHRSVLSCINEPAMSFATGIHTGQLCLQPPTSAIRVVVRVTQVTSWWGSRSDWQASCCFKDVYPPPLYKKHLRATVPSLPRGNVPQVTVPSPPRLLCKGVSCTGGAGYHSASLTHWPLWTIDRILQQKRKARHFWVQDCTGPLPCPQTGKRQ